MKPSVITLNASIDTAQISGITKGVLKQAGRPIQIKDVFWIAAHALESGAVLVSYDKRFLNIPGLRFWENI